MRTLLRMALPTVVMVCAAQAQQAAYQTHKFPHRMEITLPADWENHADPLEKKKLTFAEMMADLKTEKIHLMTADPLVPGVPRPLVSARLSIGKDFLLSQEKTARLTDAGLEKARKDMAAELLKTPVFRIDPASITLSKVKLSKNYWALKLSYIRGGVRSPGAVDTYRIPYADRTVILTVSRDVVGRKELDPVLDKIVSSFTLTDRTFWPVAAE